jgi:hypothetical protein
MYTFVFGAGSYYILKLIRKGIDDTTEPLPPTTLSNPFKEVSHV